MTKISKTKTNTKEKEQEIQKTLEEKMQILQPYFDKIENFEHRSKLYETIENILKKFPNLQTRIAWNQPMITDHGTFIIGFSVSSKHFSVAPENTPRNKFFDEYSKKYSYGKKIFRINWDEDIDQDLLNRIVEYTIEFKKDCETFWEPNLK